MRHTHATSTTEHRTLNSERSETRTDYPIDVMGDRCDTLTAKRVRKAVVNSSFPGTHSQNYAGPPMGSNISNVVPNLHRTLERPRIKDGMLQMEYGVTKQELTRNEVENRSNTDDCTTACLKAQELSREKIEAYQDALNDSHAKLLDQRAENKSLEQLVRKFRDTIQEKDLAIARTEDELKDRIDFVNELLNQTIAPFAEQNGLTPKRWTYPNVMEVQESLAGNAAEATALREQVRSLQKEMLATVENSQASPDEEFAQEFRTIVSQVKTLSRTIQLFANVDIAAALEPGVLQHGVSDYHWQGRAKKRLFVEAWIWSVLLQLVFETPFIVYGVNCSRLSTMWQNLYLTGHSNGWPTPTPLSESWRRTTMDTMLGRVDRELIATGESKVARTSLDQSVLNFRQQVVGIIESKLSRICATIVTEKVVQILNNACALAVKMSLQKFRLQVTWPEVGSNYSQDMMKALPDSDGDDIEDGGKVAFVVNPGLTKWGDTHGKNFDCRYDIVPALVQVETGAGEGNSGISLI